MKTGYYQILIFNLILLIGLSQPSISQSFPYIDSLSIVCNATSTGDGANSWGGHQCSIVRTSKGKIYTVYTVEGTSDLNRNFQVALQTGNGWQVAAQGRSGREPAQLLIGPDDRIFVVCWPYGYPKLWISDVNGENFISSDIPGSWNPNDNWPYLSTGIDNSGTLYVLASGGGKPGYFKLAYRKADTGTWSDVKKINIDYRFCYTFIIPQNSNGLHMASLRDVVWSDLGYTKPPDAFDYCFNAVKSWYSPDIFNLNFTETLIHEEIPTMQYPNPKINLNYEGDFYVDTYNRSHVICPIAGAGTGGTIRLTHYIIDRTALIVSVDLPAEIKNGRLIQNKDGKFFLITFQKDKLIIYPASDAKGLVLETPVKIDLSGHNVQYSNLHLAAPRCGVPLSNEVDIVYPSGTSAEKWIYFKLFLPEGGPTDSNLLSKKEIDIYPNPVNNALFFVGLAENGKITLFDIWGKQVFYQEDIVDRINIGNLPAGAYIMQLETQKELVLKKIIKQ